ncbi:MAG: hypothetical protein A3F12_05920 [Gammaproteobacteria bacterium RIFCSPHIGHO2_12_FULL_38_14]|nr:MAG: hypothetical protein A3F12_05920 [Gammaproteobacteria bacterium RIFCSPHIGHO2_12_FULL_38_14]
MVSINLIEWREYQTKYERNIFKRIIFYSVGFSLMLMYIIHISLTYSINKSSRTVKKLEDEQYKYQMLNERNRLTKEMIWFEKAKEKSEYNKKIIQKIFYLWGNVEASMVCFTGVEHSKNHTYFSGYAYSPETLVKFFQQWHWEELFSQINLRELKDIQQGFLKFSFDTEDQSN